MVRRQPETAAESESVPWPVLSSSGRLEAGHRIGDRAAAAWSVFGGGSPV